METQLLFQTDSYLKEFEARVLAVNGAEVALDATAFYAGGGGQPCDLGTLSDGATTWVGFGGHRIRTSFLQGLLPSVDRCGRDPDRLGHLPNTLALQKHARSDLTPHFQFLGTPCWSHGQYVSTKDLL